MSSSPAAVVIEGLTKQFGDKVAVDAISMIFPQGAFVGVVGRNGAGKTTTMKMCTALLPPSAGTVSVMGVDVWREPVAAKKKFGALPETMALFDRLTGAELRRGWREEHEARAGRRLDTLFSDLQLEPAQIAKRSSDLKLIEEAVRVGGLDHFRNKAVELLETLRAWGAHLGARIASVWPFVAAHLGTTGVQDLERIAEELVELRRALRGGCSALREKTGELLDPSLHRARRALDGIELKLDQLRHLLVAKGFAHG